MFDDDDKELAHLKQMTMIISILDRLLGYYDAGRFDELGAALLQIRSWYAEQVPGGTLDAPTRFYSDYDSFDNI